MAKTILQIFFYF